MMNSPTLDSSATAQVNVIRALASGLVWGALSAVFFPLVSWFAQPEVRGLLLMFLLVLQSGVAGFVMPLSFLIVTVMIDALLIPFSKSRILGFLMGLLMPNMKLVTALVMLVGDPLVYLIWRIFPSFIPVNKYPFITFAGFIRVEKLSEETLPDKRPN